MLTFASDDHLICGLVVWNTEHSTKNKNWTYSTNVPDSGETAGLDGGLDLNPGGIQHTDNTDEGQVNLETTKV